jgi:hypothetical protein
MLLPFRIFAHQTFDSSFSLMRSRLERNWITVTSIQSAPFFYLFIPNVKTLSESKQVRAGKILFGICVCCVNHFLLAINSSLIAFRFFFFLSFFLAGSERRHAAIIQLVCEGEKRK